MRKILGLCLVVGLGLSGCSKSPKSMNAKFSSMDSCLSSIERDSGMSLEVITDKPNDVSGFLRGTKLGFGCQAESTGTSGLVVKGWYGVED